MPFTFFAHQAPMLPLKIARPKWFSGTALVVGSMAPDFEYFLKGNPIATFGHTLVGQFTFCLPVTVLLVWLIRRVVIRPFALHLPDGGQFHLHDYQALTEPPPAVYWLKVVVSALIGSFSHVVWDSFTHEAGWGAQHIPTIEQPLFTIGGYTVHVYKALQHGSSLVGILLTVLMLYYIGKHRLLLRWAEKPSVSSYQPSPTSQRCLWLTVAVSAVIGAGISAAMIDVPNPWFSLYRWGHIFLKTAYFTFVGLCVGCVLCARQMNRRF